MSEHDYDLFWHALNYRGSATQHAQDNWEALEACVNRMIAREREECAKLCMAMRTVAGLDDVERGFNVSLRRAAEAIRARGNA